ncbi:MAG: YggS family pyridoxal phosphate-dependent enzyme, partial [Usitatibacteraceae bacterium]
MNLQGVNAEVTAAIEGRGARFSAPVHLVAVSKTKPEEQIRAAFAAGQRQFGENYVQEAVDKIKALDGLRGADGIVWHLIGPLQSNKAALAAKHFDWVQTVDREKIALALARARAEAGLPALNVLVQINVSGEQSKSGVNVNDVTEIEALAQTIAAQPSLRLRGVMSIIENRADEAVLRSQFVLVRGVFDRLRERFATIDTLSMGMSNDFAIAVSEGATMIRVGSRIFGARQAPAPEVAARVASCS